MVWWLCRLLFSNCVGSLFFVFVVGVVSVLFGNCLCVVYKLFGFVWALCLLLFGRRVGCVWVLFGVVFSCLVVVLVIVWGLFECCLGGLFFVLCGCCFGVVCVLFVK